MATTKSTCSMPPNVVEVSNPRTQSRARIKANVSNIVESGYIRCGRGASREICVQRAAYERVAELPHSG